MKNDAFRVQPKQKRGRMRVDAILNAATEVFAEKSYERATIVEIAERADTSVGSLYQFFRNKEAILKVIVDRYIEQATEIFTEMDIESFPEMVLEKRIKTMLDPLKEFIRDNRDFQVIFSNSTGSNFVAEAIRPMDEAVLARTEAAFERTNPDISAEDRHKYSLICMMIMKALLGLAHQSSELSLDDVFDEMEAIYLRYLTPIMLPEPKD